MNSLKWRRRPEQPPTANIRWRSDPQRHREDAGSSDATDADASKAGPTHAGLLRSHCIATPWLSI